MAEIASALLVRVALGFQKDLAKACSVLAGDQQTSLLEVKRQDSAALVAAIKCSIVIQQHSYRSLTCRKACLL